MPKRYWYIGLAIGLISAGLVSGVHSEQKHRAPHSKRSHHTEQSEAPPVASTKPPAYDYAYSCEKPKSAEQDNLCTNRKAANAAMDAAFWTQATAWVGIAGTIAVLATLFVSICQGIVARNAYISAHRPRIRFRGARNVTFEVGKPISVEISLVNVGDTDAVIRDISFGMALRHEDSMIPLTPHKTSPTTNRVKPGHEYTISWDTPYIFNFDDYLRITQGDTVLCIDGMINYLDVSNVGRNTGFFRKLNFARNRYVKLDEGDEYADEDFEN